MRSTPPYCNTVNSSWLAFTLSAEGWCMQWHLMLCCSTMHFAVAFIVCIVCVCIVSDGFTARLHHSLPQVIGTTSGCLRKLLNHVHRVAHQRRAVTLVCGPLGLCVASSLPKTLCDTWLYLLMSAVWCVSLQPWPESSRHFVKQACVCTLNLRRKCDPHVFCVLCTDLGFILFLCFVM